MKRCALRGAAIAYALGLALGLAMLCGCGAESKPPAVAGPPAASASTSSATSPPVQGSAAPASADGDDEAPGTCGSEICALDQFCEDLYKGHDADARGRPLHRKKCMPLPDSCKAKPTCACVTKQVASTHCTDEGGRVYVNDYPARQ
jgi:hypothetical protein